ncbi:Bcr/CflA family drug resistance efflux transporter, partial [Mycobacterium sp. ITM-2017-0098]
GTAAALLGAVQFGGGAAIAPVVGVLGNDELAMAVVMAAGVMIALIALLVTGVHRNTAPARVPGEALAEPA